MINSYPTPHKTKGLSLLTLSAILWIMPICQSAFGAEESKIVHYKKHTVVDFEEALVEGKSRKPFSAYLYQQQAPENQALASWQPDFTKQIELSKSKLGPSL